VQKKIKSPSTKKKGSSPQDSAVTLPNQEKSSPETQPTTSRPLKTYSYNPQELAVQLEQEVNFLAKVPDALRGIAKSVSEGQFNVVNNSGVPILSFLGESKMGDLMQDIKSYLDSLALLESTQKDLEVINCLEKSIASNAEKDRWLLHLQAPGTHLTSFLRNNPNFSSIHFFNTIMNR
jgi:hypothetical protein